MAISRHYRKYLLLCLCLAAVPGCVRRRITVRTNPPGAMVYMDRQLMGPSPVSVNTTYYGTRLIEVVGDGYRTEKILRTFNPPWYEIPPLDFVSETLWPWEIRDQRVVDITLVPEPIVPSEELINRGQQLRGQAALGIATPLGKGQGGQVMPPTGSYPVVPIDPNAGQPSAQPVLPPGQTQPAWRPGQFLRGFLQPGGQPVERIPEVQGLQGGGYRPELDGLTPQ